MSPDARDEIEVAELPVRPPVALEPMPDGRAVICEPVSNSPFFSRSGRGSRKAIESEPLPPRKLGRRPAPGLSASRPQKCNRDGRTPPSRASDSLIAGHSAKPPSRSSRRWSGHFRRSITGSVGRLPHRRFGPAYTSLDVDEAAQRDAELPGRRGDDLQAEEHVGPRLVVAEMPECQLPGRT